MSTTELSLEDTTFAEWRARNLRNPITYNPDGSFPEQIRNGWRYKAFVAGFTESHARGVKLGDLGIKPEIRSSYWAVYGVGELYRKKAKR